MATQKPDLSFPPMPPDLSKGQQDTWKDQDRFFNAFVKCGTRYTACHVASISIGLPYYWADHDLLNFNARYALAEKAWADYLEQVAFDRIESPDKNRGSDLLLITMLNAYKPDRYKPALVVNDSALKETLDTLRLLKRKLREHETQANQEQGLLEAPDAIEEARDILAARLPPRPQAPDVT